MDCGKGRTFSYQQIHLIKGAHEDIHWWHSVLDKGNGSMIFLDLYWSTAADFYLTTISITWGYQLWCRLWRAMVLQ